MYFKNKCVGCQTVSFFTTSPDIKFYYILSKYVSWNNSPPCTPNLSCMAVLYHHCQTFKEFVFEIGR